VSALINILTTANAKLRCALAGLSVVIALTNAGDLAAQAAAATSTVSSKDAAIGIHFVFDASGSMCGYLKGNDEHRALLTLIRFAGGLRDVEQNRRVVLIRQKQRQASDGGLVEAAAEELQALAAAGPSSSVCAPLDGSFSNVAKIFDKPRFAPQPRSFVLVSDMVLKEGELTEFVDRFRQWARSIGVDQPHSVGLLSLGVNAAGRYYPVTDKANEARGYALPAYIRPLHLLWFAVGDADQRVVRDMLKQLGVQGGARPANWLYGLQLLPQVSEDPQRWLIPSPPLQAAVLFDAPQAQVVVRPGSERDRRILQSCAQPRFNGQELLINGGSCRDEKLLFDASVDHVRVVLPLRTGHGLRLVEEPPLGTVATDDSGTVTLTVQRRTISDQYRFVIVPTPAALTDAELSKRSADTDTCPPTAARGAAAQAQWTEACVRLLEGKTYRYDALVRQLASRAEDVLRERYGTRTVGLKVVVKP